MCTRKILLMLVDIALDDIVSTRSFLHTGKRGAVDMALCRLVKSGVLLRVTPGLFIKNGSKWPSTMAIAQAKAMAFGKQLIPFAESLAAKFELCDAPPLAPVFGTVGGSSRFQAGNLVVAIKPTACRKAMLDRTEFGQMIRAVWHQGANHFDQKTESMLLRAFRGKGQSDLKEHSPWMPAWLNNVLVS